MRELYINAEAIDSKESEPLIRGRPLSTNSGINEQNIQQCVNSPTELKRFSEGLS